LQFIIVAAFGAFCFGCGYLTAFVVTRDKWRDEMSLADSVNLRKIKRVAQSAESKRRQHYVIGAKWID